MPNHLEQLLVEELRDLYSAEKQILRALPKMAKAASHEELRNALDRHRQVTEDQVQRLEQLFESMDARPGRKKCKGMEGLIEEGEERMEELEEPAARDAAIIAAAQRIEHYEIAGYGTARTYAQHLGLDQAARLLQNTLDEESEADDRLTEIAESTVNVDALSAPSRRGSSSS